MTPTTTRLDTDYLVLGAGAMGMAFADVILAEDPSAQLIMVDRRPGPGGHWNDAYPFVRLHQPAAFYGLNSMNLGQGGADLTSGPEVVAYFNNAMDRFRATGRLRFLPMSEHRGDGRVVSVVDPDRAVTVTARRRIVDSTYMRVEVPSTHPPRYVVDEGVELVPPNGLTRIRRPHERYVVIGAGKTGIDAIVFLLDQGTAPERISWIVPSDSWLWDRATVQPGGALETLAAMMRAVASTTDVDEIYLRLEREAIVFRVDRDRLPTKWRCATVDRRELQHLRSVEDVVRMGRVQRVRPGALELDDGTLEVPEDTLFVDCTADGLAKRPPQPLFADGALTLQSVFMCQQTFSASLLAHLELLNTTDAHRNRICTPVPHPELKEDLPGALMTSAQNMLNCNLQMARWLRGSRVFLGHHETLRDYLVGSAKLAALHRRAVGVRGAPAPV
jgi:hypothetical protein